MIMREAAKASAIFNMFPDDGKVLIGLSGGADSVVLVDILSTLSKKWRKNIEFIAVHIDAGFFTLTDDELYRMRAFCEERRVMFLREPYYNISDFVRNKQTRLSECFICSRMRRKRLLEIAAEQGISTLALGHHKDDVIETFLLNILLSRQISAILPNQPLFGGTFHIVRPLAFVDESRIKRYAEMCNFPRFNKNCEFAGETERQWIKDLIVHIEKERPGTKKNILRSLFYPKTDYLLGNYVQFAEKLLR